jgi:hypothetical protein
MDHTDRLAWLVFWFAIAAHVLWTTACVAHFLWTDQPGGSS